MTRSPLPADHPLRSTQNTLLVAHCGWATDETYAQMVPETVAVIEAFPDGAPYQRRQSAGRRLGVTRRSLTR